jgi:hypothetical protein
MIADCGFRIADLERHGVRSQETEFRIQEKNRKKRVLFPTGYWLLTTVFSDCGFRV